MRLISLKHYERQLWEDQICEHNILKLGHQNHWKNTENRKIIVVVYTKKERKTFFNNLKISNTPDNNTFWENIKPIFSEKSALAWWKATAWL